MLPRLAHAYYDFPLSNLFFRRNIASLASMQGADDTDSDGEEGQAFYAGGSERR